MESEKCLCEKIEDVRRQLNGPMISPCRRRDLTKYMWRLKREFYETYGRPYRQVVN